METLISIFEKTGCKVLTETSGKAGTSIQYMNNTDGSVRWAWPSHLKKPLFLKFYNQDTKRGKLFSFVIKLVFMMRLQKLFFKSTKIMLVEGEKAMINLKDKWAIFTGTVGPNRKAILYKEDRKGKSFFKIALGANAAALLNNEHYTIHLLNYLDIKSFRFPQVLSANSRMIQLSDISGNSKRCSSLNQMHLDAVNELSKKTASSNALKDLSIWNNTITSVEGLVANVHPAMPKGMLRKIYRLIDSIDENTEIQTSFSHGDFTSWNTFEQNGRLNIYDWELAKTNMPIGFDVFHFIVQQGILVDRQPWKQIEKEIKEKINANTLQGLYDNAIADTDLYLKLYLLINTVYYLKLYSSQQNWHMQISWLLNTWNDALSSMLAKNENHRELVIMDMFDYLHNKQYVALKFPGIQPEKISEYSDIDLCINKEVEEELRAYLSGHSIVKHVKTTRKSFMSSLQLFFEDGSLLSLDLIWQIKRKGLEMMDARDVLNNGYINEYGVKMPSLINNVRYIGLFYAMNNARVPGKYEAYEEALRNKQEILDMHLYSFFVDGSDVPEIINILKARRVNRGVHAAINQLKYVFDSVKGFVGGRGMVITFSGVDGAGKSTVIENVRHNLDKKLRKKVIVIRHRPSLLPILSAWTKGKEAAEKEAASGLPRQGDNNSLLSSIFRFSYYYADYLFGQFYVYFKYVMRGYVVLYDRYYFDFINDSRRSNIKLPHFITRNGYRLLMKPDLNFFLYADAELILSRKKELDADTIKSLTNKYLQLFEDLNHNAATRRYIPIENIELKETLESIMNRMTYKAA